MPTLREIEAPALKSLLDAGKAVIIDVREPDEHIIERIAGSTSAPLSRFDALAIPADNGRTIVLHCKGGMRSQEAAAQLVAAGRDAAYLRGGLDAWKQAGLPTQRLPKAPLPIMRQVQIIVGTLILLFSILSYLISPGFLFLTGFFGAGLLFAGSTGFCGMAQMLRFMPWNKAIRAAGQGCGAECK